MHYNYENIYSLDEIIKLARPIFERYKCSDVSIFGSYAKNQANCFSDIDFLIKEKGNVKSYLDLCGLGNDLEDALKKPVDLVTSHCDNKEFVQEIRKDCVKVC